MIERIAHRGPDACGCRRSSTAPRRVHAGAPPALDHRPVHRGRPAVRQGRPDPQPTTASSTTTASCATSCGTRRVVRDPLRHRGRARGLARLGHAALAALSRHVRVRDPRRAHRRPDPGPRSARHQAAVRHARAATGVALRLRAQGDHGRGRPRAGDRPGRHGRVDALLLGARAARALEGVSKLPAGTWAEYHARRQHQHAAPYWNAAGGAPRRPAGPARPRRGHRGLGRRAPGRRRAVATFLSGGLDSSIVTALASATNPDIEAYTITFRPGPAAGGDARRRAATPARWPPFRHQAARDRDRPDVVELLPRMVDMLDEPIGDPGGDQHAADVRGRARAGVKVLLSGMGADELFGGYRKHLACVLAAAIGAAPDRCASGVAPTVRQPARRGRRPRAAHGPLGEALPDLRRAARRSGVPAQLHAVRPRRSSTDLLDPDPRRQSTSCSTSTRGSTTTTTSTDHVNRMCLADTRLFLPGLNLAYTDRASMAASTRCACRSSTRGRRRGVLAARRGQDPRPDQKAALKDAAASLAARGDHPPAQGVVRRPAAGLGHATTCAA